MIAASDSLQRLHAFEAARRESFTGALMGLDLPARDRLLVPEFERFGADLDAARLAAACSGRPVDVEGARVSLTEAGDTWTVHPDGHMDREFSRFEGFEDLLAALAAPPELDPSRALDPEELLWVTYHGFWSPSATNWQPTRMVELEGPLRDRVFEAIGWPLLGDLPAMLLLRRDRYESLLGDVLEPFGLVVTAQEESLDAGIFAATMAMAALGRGLTFREHVLSPAERAQVAEWLDRELERRTTLLVGSEPEIVLERQKLIDLRAMVERGAYLPDSLFVIGHPQGAPLERKASFGCLVDAHSTQRVASPSRDFSSTDTQRLWQLSCQVLAPAEREQVDFVFFHRDQQTPRALGHAMFQALYGQGADPETKTGGEGGLLTAVTIGNYLCNLEPAYVAALLGAGWKELDESALQRATRHTAVKASDLGTFMRDRITRDGKYRLEGDHLVDLQGKPLAIPLFVRLNRSLAATFGNFFLKFQNTHPQNGVMLARPGAGDPHGVFRNVGKVGACMTYLARAWGATSILKTGPIDLAREAIRAILAENGDGLEHLAALVPGLQNGSWVPAMTFQVGYPLAGTEVVEAGTPQAHTGIEERRRDKRPPRARFSAHYFPAL